MNFGFTWVFPTLMTLVSYRDMSQHIKTFANERGTVSCVQVNVSKRCVEVRRENFHRRGVTFSLVISNLFILICCLNWRKEYSRNSKRDDRNKCLCVRGFCFSTPASLKLPFFFFISALVFSFMIPVVKSRTFKTVGAGGEHFYGCWCRSRKKLN